jgi:hypothetical protein
MHTPRSSQTWILLRSPIFFIASDTDPSQEPASLPTAAVPSPAAMERSGKRLEDTEFLLGTEVTGILEIGDTTSGYVSAKRERVYWAQKITLKSYLPTNLFC